MEEYKRNNPEAEEDKIKVDLARVPAAQAPHGHAQPGPLVHAQPAQQGWFGGALGGGWGVNIGIIPFGVVAAPAPAPLPQPQFGAGNLFGGDPHLPRLPVVAPARGRRGRARPRARAWR
jgi:hypothetical protein